MVVQPMTFKLKRTPGLRWLRTTLLAGVLIAAALILWEPSVKAIPVDSGPVLPPIEVYFSPKNGATVGATAAIVREIDAARGEILVQAYSFTSEPIARALLKAHRRGIRVAVILDKGQQTQKYSSFTFLKNQGIPTWIDAKHAIAHNKIILIDRQVVITGSFNFTKAAEERNAENLLIIRSKELSARYLENWQHHRDHSAAA
jgi:phosphatidylserine/phosphatidylglycerophosphate/cardiolipin synthase-like enzyme